MIRTVIYALISGLFLLSCGQQRTSEHVHSPGKDSSVVAIKEESARPVHWSYEENGGPGNWAILSPVYAACGSGKSQSPIDIVSDSTKGSVQWGLEYGTSSLTIAHNEHVNELINNGHTIQVTPDQGSKLNYSGKVYNLKQFHFHTPSEHTLNGKHAPMEIHFVHQSEDKNLAVVGVLVHEGKHNQNFDQLIRFLPDSVGDKKTHDSVSIDISLHVPKDLWAYHYVGSLTTPPCTENVQWLVLHKHMEMDKAQIEAFSRRLKKNNRPTQQMNGRTMTLDDIRSK